MLKWIGLYLMYVNYEPLYFLAGIIADTVARVVWNLILLYHERKETEY